MLALNLMLLAFVAQDPVPGSEGPADPDRTAEVIGRVELSPAAADASARQAAAQEVRWELERRGEALLASVRPMWMPGFVADLVLARWIRNAPLDRAFRVVDAAREERDHGSYRSYRTRLRIRPDERLMEATLGDLRRGVASGARRFAWLSAGTAGLWAFLALLYGWLDRLTRGYMPWRLRLVCVGMGVAAPGIALLFV